MIDASLTIKILEESGIDLNQEDNRGLTLIDLVIRDSVVGRRGRRDFTHNAQVEQAQSWDLVRWMKELKRGGAVKYSLHRDCTLDNIDYDDWNTMDAHFQGAWR